jgi:hypothetical protein
VSESVVARRARRHRRRGTSLLILIVVALTVAVACAGFAFVVRADTSDLQARAEPVNGKVRELTASEHDAERRLGILRTRSRAAGTTLAALLAAYQAQVDASNHAVDVANQAVDRYNSGQADVAAAFQGAGDAAMTDVEQKTAAEHTAFSAAQRAITQLMVSGG